MSAFTMGPCLLLFMMMAKPDAATAHVCSDGWDTISNVTTSSYQNLVNDCNTMTLFTVTDNRFSVPGSSAICLNSNVFGLFYSDFVMDTNSFINLNSFVTINLYTPATIATNCEITVNPYGTIGVQGGSITMHSGARWLVGSHSNFGDYDTPIAAVLTIGANTNFTMSYGSRVIVGDAKTSAKGTLTLNDGTSLTVGNSAILQVGVNSTLITLNMGQVAAISIGDRVSLTISDGIKCLVTGPVVNVSNSSKPIVWGNGFKEDNVMCVAHAKETHMMEMMQLKRVASGDNQ